MPKQKTVERARRAKRQGKSATTEVNLRVMKKEPRDTVSRAALSRRAKKVTSKKVTSKKTSKKVASRKPTKRAAATMKSTIKRLARPSAASRKAGRARKRRTT